MIREAWSASCNPSAVLRSACLIGMQSGSEILIEGRSKRGNGGGVVAVGAQGNDCGVNGAPLSMASKYHYLVHGEVGQWGASDWNGNPAGVISTGVLGGDGDGDNTKFDVE